MDTRLILALLPLVASAFSTDAFAAFGRTAGTFDVSAVGSAQYSIPIWVPPGIRGIQPKLALSYDSRLGYGLMGPGWTLGGLSAIARCNPTYAQDGTPEPITLTTTDGLCLDGNRLRTTGTGVYQTEIANFSQVAASGTAGGGPSYFTVQGKNGLTYEYGNTTDSKILPSGSTTPYIWALDKVTDRSGNHMTFTYYQSGGAYVPLNIQYTAPSGSTTFPYKVTFVYTTKSSTDTISKYIAGAQIQQTNQLSTITVTSSAATVREYKLLYTTSPTTLRATLTSIQECGGSAGTDCLAATSVGYQNGTAGVVNPATASGSGATNGTVYSVDIDGDGKQDLVFATASGSNYQWWVQLATATGYGSPISTGAVTVSATSILLDDFYGTGKTELLAPVGGIWYSYKLNGTSFVATSTGTAVIANVSYSSADVDGDGLPDLVNVSKGSDDRSINYGVQLNTGKGSAISFASAPVINNLAVGAAILSAPQVFGNNQIPSSSVKHLDFDGDGRQDVVISYEYFIGFKDWYAVQPVLSRGAGTPVFQGGYGSTVGGTIQPVNWNDDACTDLIFGTELLISQCNGSTPINIALPAAPTLALDWDGDGRTDALANVGGTWQIYRSEGSTVAPVVSTGIPVGTGTWIVTDQNGDGLPDLAFSNSAASNAIYYGLHAGSGVRPDLAISLNDGYGNSVSPKYGYLTQSGNLYFNFTDAIAGYQNYIGPLYVVSQATFSDPTNAPSGTYLHTYSYYGAWLNLLGRGFSGFNDIGDLDSRDGVWDVKYYRRDFPYTGLHPQEQIFQPNSQSVLARETDNTFLATILDNVVNNQRYFPYVNQSTNKEYQVGGAADGQLITTAVTNYTYDTSGNATNVATVITDNDAASPYYSDTWSATTAHTISPDTTTWCLNLPTETTVTHSSTAPGGAAITRTVTYTPDYTNCRETQRVIEPNSATYKVTEAYGYDTTVGNLLTDTVTGVGMTPRVTTLTWNSTGQFPATIKNPLSQTITLGFDPNSGRQTSQTDLNSTTANPLVTTWGYDDFARPIAESRLDGTSTTWSYNSCATAECVNSNNKMTVTKTALNVGGSTLAVENIYLDSQDRTLVTSGSMLNGAFDRHEVQYDNLGRVHQQGAPCTFVSCANYWTTNTYDMLNRLTQSQRPISATNSTLQTTMIQYAGRTMTATDPQGKNIIKINLVTGSLARTQDDNGYYINFNYDAFGSLLSVKDSLSNTLNSMTYDYGLQAFQRTSSDADLGARSSTYDALGERTAYSDAKGQNFSVFYDALSRPTNRTEPDLTTTWTWGNTAASFNIGKLQSVAAASSVGTYSESYGYDNKTRLSTGQVAIPGDATYTYTRTYNPTTGLLDTLQYPISTSSYQLKLQYTYANGILQKISDAAAGTQFWLANTTNPRGQLTQETLGNGVVVKHALDAVTGWVSSIQAGVGGGAALQNNSYLFDEVGNLTQRQDNNVPVVTENVYPDNLYRLDHTVGDSNTQMTYDSMGRIATWAQYGQTTVTNNFTTPQSGCTYYANSQLHAVRSSTAGTQPSQSFCYDANGNTTTISASGITLGSVVWTSFNQPSGIVSGTTSGQLFYNANHQRYKQIASYAGSPETTYYVGGLLEKVINSSGTAYRHYIPAGNNLVLYTRSSTGANPTYYITKDHLGSSAVISDATGASLVKEKFGAWGFNENTATEQATIAGISRHEFTGQEQIDNTGVLLTNMNGRIYSPVGSIFLSPDPYVPHPGYTQSFNRYSYVNNNPLTYTDPSGFDDSDDGLDEIVVTASAIVEDTGSFLGNIFSDIWDDIFGGGGGGGPQLSPAQRLAQSQGINLSSPLQSAPSAQPVGSDASAQWENANSIVPTQVTPVSYATGTFDTSAINTASTYSDIAATYTSLGDPTDPNDVRTSFGSAAPQAADQLEGVTVTASRAIPGNGDFNFAGFSRAATRINIDRTLLQFTGTGAGVGSALGLVAVGIAGAPTMAALQQSVQARLAARLLSGAVDATYGQLTEELAEHGIIQEAQQADMELLDQLGGAFRATEIANPEITAPELPWDP